MPFLFDRQQNFDSNWQSFINYLNQAEPELTPLLEAAIQRLQPLPPQGPQRNQARQRTNEWVLGQLDHRAESEI